MTPTYDRRSPSWAWAWYALLAPPAVYFVQLLLGYALVPVACTTSRIPMILLSALVFIAALVAVIAGYGQWRELTRRGEAMAFLALLGSLLGLVFLLLIAMTGVATGLLEACRL